jgi:pimeloyl-ACP methyl ester carboxylesterase
MARWAAVVIAALAAVAVMSPGAAGAATFEPTACPTAPEGIAQQLTEANAHCGFLNVPENRANPNSRTIQLAVAIVPAKTATPAPDPLVFMTGGPGGNAFGMIRGAVSRIGMNDQRDVIFVEQRGTLFNNPALFCPEVDAFKHRAVHLRSFAKGTRKLYVRATSACRQRLLAAGVDISAYNTTENAADFDDLRIALGLKEWDVYGGSYGSDLALTYMRLFPQGIRSAVIDSIVPPDVASLSWVWTNVQDGVTNLFGACAAQKACSKRYPHLTRTFNRVVRQLERDPVTTRVKEDGKRVKVLLDGGALLNWITEATTTEPAEVPATIDATASGRYGPLGRARAAAAGDQVAQAMSNSVLCSEWIPFEPFSAIRQQGRLSFPRLPRSVLAQAPGLPFLADGACQAWGVPPAPAAVRSTPNSPIRTLVYGGTFDALTGVRWAQYVAGKLPNSTLVVVPAVGHGAVGKSTCGKNVFASFLANPSAPDTSCIPGFAPASTFQFDLSKPGKKRR